MVTQPVNEANTAVLAGNMHPLASPEFDRGAVSDTFDSGTIFFILRRSEQQEAELQHVIADRHDPSSSDFHQWPTGLITPLSWVPWQLASGYEKSRRFESWSLNFLNQR
jgi:hypothetical protein